MDDLIHQLQKKGSAKDLNLVILNYADQVTDDPDLHGFVAAFLEMGIEQQDPLYAAYESILKRLNDKYEQDNVDPSQSLKFVRQTIKKTIRQLPKPLRGIGAEFISEAIKTKTVNLEETYQIGTQGVPK